MRGTLRELIVRLANDEKNSYKIHVPSGFVYEIWQILNGGNFIKNVEILRFTIEQAFQQIC